MAKAKKKTNQEDVAMSILCAVVSARPSASPVDINQDLVVNCFKAADVFLDVASNYKSKQNEDQED